MGLPVGKFVRSGDYVSIKPHHCMTHDNSWPVAQKFFSIGATKIHDNRQIVMTLDHDVQNKSETNLRKYQNIEELAKRMGVDFYGAGRGIGHQILVEEGYAWPGTLTVASDSHSNMYGGISCLGTPIVRTDAAAIWATGQTWWQIPPVARVELKGVLPKGVTGKDVIVSLCGLFNSDEVLNHAIEFVGSEQTLESLKIDDRLTIANMTTEWGALSGIFPMDNVLKDWMLQKASMHAQRLRNSSHPRLVSGEIEEFFALNTLSASPDASYAKSLTLDLSTLSPHVAGPNSVKISTPLTEIEEKKVAIQKAYLVSCTNSRASDIAAAAEVFKSNPSAKVAPGVEFYIAAASTLEEEAATKAGDWDALINAGAKALPAGCGPCIGLGTGLLKDGEVGISATNRNFKGRMGSKEALAYLASPEVVVVQRKDISPARGAILDPPLSYHYPPHPHQRHPQPNPSTLRTQEQRYPPTSSLRLKAKSPSVTQTISTPMVFTPGSTLRKTAFPVSKWPRCVWRTMTPAFQLFETKRHISYWLQIWLRESSLIGFYHNISMVDKISCNMGFRQYLYEEEHK